MGVVKERSGLAQADRLADRYGGVPVIYVEADDDRYVFGDCWFKHWLSRIEFQAAALQCGTAGCSGGIDAVASDRQAGNFAWGIVDRDTVMSRCLWNLVNETDDAIYTGLASQEFGPEIKLLCRWEMENYLIDGLALEQCRAERAMTPERSADVVYQELLADCQMLISHAAINSVCHKYHVKGLGDGYANRFACREEMEADIQQGKLASLAAVNAAAHDDYGQQIAHLQAFDQPAETDAIRVTALLRRLHGKALLERYAHRCKLQDELRGTLANRILEMKRVPAEIEEFVEHVIRQSQT